MLRRFALVRQTDQNDCGAAALATLALHYRMPVALERLRALAGTDRAGTNLRGLVSAAEAAGFTVKAVQAPYEALCQVPLPAIAHVVLPDGLGHFVVLHRAGPRGVVVGDPARGVVRLSRTEFCAVWTGRVMLAAPESRPEGDHPPVAATPGARLVRLLTGNRRFLCEAFCCAMLMTLLGVSTSYFVKHLVDSVLVRNETRLLHALGVGMLTVVVFRALFGAVRQYLLSYVSRRIDLTLIAGYARHILHLPISFFETRQVGEILARINDAAKVREAVSGTTLTIVVDGTLVVAATLVLWQYDSSLAMVATLFVPLLALCVVVHNPSVKRRSRASMESAARLSAHLVEDMSGVETIKAYGIERRRLDQCESRLVQNVQETFGLQMIGVSATSAAAVINGAAGIVILWYGGLRVMEGALTIGELMFFHTLLGYMLGPLERLSGVNLQLQDALTAVDRLYQVMDLPTESKPDVRQAQLLRPQEAIELENVTFRYGCRDDVLKNISLTVPVGKTLAVVGESGSGKSTLLKLLTRFHDPSEGRITIDGIDMRDLDLASLRAQIGLVSQEPFIFCGTVRENIAIGRPDADANQIVAAARDAGLDAFLASLPDRYDTIIGERGSNLSGGQRQRLAIARALLRQPEILIFDEATSHLDTATERAIQESLRHALVGKTVILVAHRLSTIRHADLICVLDRGQIVENGAHAELLALNGKYASLWKAQSGVAGSGSSPGAIRSPAYRCTGPSLNGHALNGPLFAGDTSHV